VTSYLFKIVSPKSAPMAGDTLFFSQEEQQQIITCIQQAEKQTSGEVRVHIEKNCPGDVMERAKQVFLALNLHRTEQRNGVLFYLAYDDHKFAVLGDAGIDEKVTAEFWNSTKDLLRSHFAQGKFLEGFCKGIEEAGFQLKKHFPYRSGDINELPDDISFGS
jgi:uncharacterized membrane protein